MNDFVETVQENPPMEQTSELANNLNNDSLNEIKQTMDLGAKEESWLENLFDRIGDWVEDVFDISGDKNTERITPGSVVTGGTSPIKEYVGPSLKELEYKIEQARDDLEKAEKRLQEAARNGEGTAILTMQVNSCRELLDARIKQYNNATAALGGAADTQTFAANSSSENGEVKFASVSHKQWELEQAIESGNKVAIENKKRALAHEIAMEETKKMQGK